MTYFPQIHMGKLIVHDLEDAPLCLGLKEASMTTDAGANVERASSDHPGKSRKLSRK